MAWNHMGVIRYRNRPNHVLVIGRLETPRTEKEEEKRKSFFHRGKIVAHDSIFPQWD